MKKILFSAVGTTDPISNMHDGSYLHICRYHKPDIVILYLSAEMLENHKKDNRYLDSIRRLNDFLGTEIQVEFITNDTLDNVHLFDFFIKEFTNLIQKVRLKYPDYEIILNVSSGTPAMKSSLQLIAGLSEGAITAYQVATPARRSNPNRTDYNDYDPSIMWEYNEDNTKNLNRVEESDTTLQYVLIKLDMIYGLLDDYEYAAAVRIARGIRKHLSPRAFVLLEAAVWRTQLAADDIKRNLTSQEINLLFGTNRLSTPFFEYILSLQGKLRRDDYDGMLRAISPAVSELMVETLRIKCNLTITDYCHITKTKNQSNSPKSYRWDEQKLNFSDQGKDILAIVKAASSNRTLSFITNDQLLLLISKRSDSSSDSMRDLYTTLLRLRGIEETVRNIAAHQITKITDEWIKENCNLSSAEILKLLKTTLEDLELARNQDWAAYERMNECLKAQLKIEFKSKEEKA